MVDCGNIVADVTASLSEHYDLGGDIGRCKSGLSADDIECGQSDSGSGKLS